MCAFFFWNVYRNLENFIAHSWLIFSRLVKNIDIDIELEIHVALRSGGKRASSLWALLSIFYILTFVSYTVINRNIYPHILISKRKKHRKHICGIWGIYPRVPPIWYRQFYARASLADILTYNMRLIWWKCKIYAAAAEQFWRPSRDVSHFIMRRAWRLLIYYSYTINMCTAHGWIIKCNIATYMISHQ